MKLRTIFTAAALTALFAAAPVVAHAEHHGDSDDHHEWRDAHQWHDNHPGWIYQHDPEVVTVYPEWRTSSATTMKGMCGTIAVRRTTTIPNGSVNIIMTGHAGATNES